MSELKRDPQTSARWINALFGTVLIGTCLLAQSDQPGPPCLFKLLFHAPCPGCGLTRSFKALWRGEGWLAVRYHPLGPLYFALCASFLLVALFQRPLAPTRFSVPQMHQWLLQKRTIQALTVLMLGVWLLRLSFFLAETAGVHNALTQFWLS